MAILCAILLNWSSLGVCVCISVFHFFFCLVGPVLEKKKSIPESSMCSNMFVHASSCSSLEKSHWVLLQCVTTSQLICGIIVRKCLRPRYDIVPMSLQSCIISRCTRWAERLIYKPLVLDCFPCMCLSCRILNLWLCIAFSWIVM